MFGHENASSLENWVGLDVVGADEGGRRLWLARFDEEEEELGWPSWLRRAAGFLEMRDYYRMGGMVGRGF